MYWQLPSFDAMVSGTYTLYSQNYGLFTVGDGFYVLQFNEYDNNINQWKWRKIKMNKKRKHLSAAMITDKQLMCCGGGGNEQLVDLYDFEAKKWTNSCDMTTERNSPGIVAEKYMNERVYVGGGKPHQKKTEYYDIVKNKWYLLAETAGSHGRDAIMWMDDANTVNIASSYANTFERMDIRENKWTTYIGIGTNKSFESVFGRGLNRGSDTYRLCMM